MIKINFKRLAVASVGVILLASPLIASAQAASFNVNDRVQTLIPLNVRSSPLTSAAIVGRATTGATGVVIGGPQTANGYTWWQINYDSGISGWSADGSSEADYLQQVSSSASTFNTGDRVQTTLSLKVRSSPSTSAAIVGRATTGTAGTIIGGPQTANGYTWWQINYDSGISGWSAEGDTSGAVFLEMVTGGTAGALTPTLTANGSHDITVNVGDSINYAWNSTGGASAASTYTIDAPDTCGNGVGPNTWAYGNTISGTRSDTIYSCMAGRTYTITYTVTDSSNQTHSASMTVRVRAANASAMILSASPNPCTFAPGAATCSSTISWNIPVGVTSQVWVTVPGTAPELFSCKGGPDTASQVASWIQASQWAATFSVYNAGSCDLAAITGKTADSSITVSGSSASTSDAPTASLTASPTSITAGQTSTLTWSSSNATSCTVTGTNFSQSGTSNTGTLIGPGQTTTYTLACTGAGGSATRSATVTVNSGTVSAGAPTITDVSPTSGSGSSIALTINGTGFDATQNQVFLSGIGGACGLSYLASTNNGTQILCTLSIAGWTPGTYSLTVKNVTTGLTSAGTSFTITTPTAVSISSLSHTSVATGATLTITGTGFETTNTNTIGFSGPQVVNVTAASTNGTTLSVTVPTLAPGTYSVSVSNAANTNAAPAYAPSTITITSSTVAGAPTITNVTPASLPLGGSAQVTITGTGFDPSSNFVTFSGGGVVNNVASSNGGTQISFSLSSAGFGYAGTYPLAVRNNANNRTSNGYNITLTAPEVAAPTATLYANNQSDINVYVGDTVSYAFTNSNCASISRTVSVDGGASQPWGNPSTCSTTSDGGVIAPSQAGHTYVLTYTVTNSAGQSTSASATVRVRGATSQTPTATLWANGSTDLITVNVGTFIHYLFANTNCVSVTTTVSVDGGASQPWNAGSANCSTTSGGFPGPVLFDGYITSDQAGHTYVLTYTVNNGTGGSASDSVTIRVNSISSASNPYANIASALSAIAAILEKMRGQ